MKKIKKNIQRLIEDGEKFTYENFSTKSERGYPNAFTPEWVAWRTRAKNLISQTFGDNSAPLEMLNAGLMVHVIGNGEDKFQQSMSYILGALRAASEIVEEDTFGEFTGSGARGPGARSNRVFVVHGHDEKSKAELEVLLGELGLEPIVLHRKPDEGQTIIEKFEKYSDVGYAFVLLTPDEVAYLVDQEERPDAERDKERRARPNVIFEFGYFVGRLRRVNVCCLYTGDVTLPSDVSGVIYKKFTSSISEVAYDITKELKARGYKLT